MVCHEVSCDLISPPINFEVEISSFISVGSLLLATREYRFSMQMIAIELHLMVTIILAIGHFVKCSTNICKLKFLLSIYLDIVFKAAIKKNLKFFLTCDDKLT